MLRTEYRDELGMDDLDQRLPRGEAPGNVFANRALTDALDERFDDGQSNVGLEQRKAHLPQRILDVVVGQPALAR